MYVWSSLIQKLCASALLCPLQPHALTLPVKHDPAAGTTNEEGHLMGKKRR